MRLVRYAWRCLACAAGGDGWQEDVVLDVNDHTVRTGHAALAMPVDQQD